MTQKLILTDDQIQSSVSTSSFPPSSTAVKTELDKKVNIQQGATEAGKALIVGSDGNVTTGTIEAQTQADWSQTTTTEASYIKNKPFITLGSGLVVTSGILSTTGQFQFKVFATLPTAGSEYAQTVALIETTTTDVYDQYGCVNEGTTATPSWAWKKLGQGEFKVDIQQTTEGISINSTALQDADTSNTGLLTHADWTTFNAKQDALTFDTTPQAGSNNPVKSSGIKSALDLKEDVANKVTSWSATVSDTHYPSEKLVKNNLDAKVDLASSSSAITIGKNGDGRYYFEE